MRSSKARAFDNAADSSSNDGPTLERHLRGHKDCITAITFNPSMKQLVTSSVDSSLLLWNLENNVRAFRFVAHKEAVHDVAFSPSGNLIASASRDRTVRFWTPAVYGSSGEFRAHTASVRSVHFSPDGKNIITSSDDKTVKLWTVAKKRFVQSFNGHTNWVRCARYSGDGSIIASCSDDRSTKLFDPNSGKCVHSFEEDKAHAVHLSWHPSGTCFAVALTNSVIRIYDIRALKLVQHYRSHEKPVNQVTFHPSGDYLLSASDDSTMKIIDVIEGRPIYTLQGHEGAATAVSFSPDGQYFASAGVDKQVFVWKTNFDKHGWRSAHTDDKCSLNETSADLSSPAAHCYDARAAISRMKQTDVAVESYRGIRITGPKVLQNPSQHLLLKSQQQKNIRIQEVYDTVISCVFTTVQSSGDSCDSLSSDDANRCCPSRKNNHQYTEERNVDKYKNGTSHSKEFENLKGLLSGCGDECSNSNCGPAIATALEKICGQLEMLRTSVELMNQRVTLMEEKLLSSNGHSNGNEHF